MTGETSTQYQIYAVTDGPDGDDVVRLSSDRYEAVQLRHKHRNVFYCSTQADGCGGSLQINAGPVVRPYFHHKGGGAGGCLAGEGGGEGFRHLEAKRALLAWLSAQGLEGQAEKRVRGGRADVHVRVEELDAIVEVQISPLSYERWQERDNTYRRGAHSVTWLFEPDSPRAADLVADGGYALHLDATCLSVTTRDRELAHDVSLTECLMNPTGIWTPHVDRARLLHERYLQEQAEQQRRAREQAAAQEALRPPVQERDGSTESARSVRATNPRTPAPFATPLSAEPRVRTEPQAWPVQRSRFTPELYPEFPGWLLTCGYDFDSLPPHLRAAAQMIGYYVCGLVFAGPVNGLPNFSTSDTEMLDIVNWLEQNGAIRTSELQAVKRWQRGTSP